EEMTGLADALRQPAQAWLAAVMRALLTLLAGRFEEAEHQIDQARSLGERAQPWSAAVTHGLQLYVLRRDQGRLEEMAELVGRATADYRTYPIWRCVLSAMLPEVGSTENAPPD